MRGADPASVSPLLHQHFSEFILLWLRARFELIHLVMCAI